MSCGTKWTLEDCRIAATNKHGKCLSEEYINCGTKMLWECEKKHQWYASFNSINQGHWCKICTRTKHTLDDCKRIAEARGGKCLSEEYVNCNIKMSWECACGYKWEAPFTRIKRGAWCKKCHNESQKGSTAYSIEYCQDLAESHGGKCLSEKYISFNTKMLWECEEKHQWSAKFGHIKDGHWCRTCFDNSRLTLKDAQILAKKKNIKCLSMECTNSFTSMVWECEYGHVWNSSYTEIRRGSKCSVCEKIKKLETAQSLAEKKNGKCLSKSYVDPMVKMKWECHCGCIWYASYSFIRTGKWCPECYERGVKQNTKYTIEQCKEEARKRGGKCLSDQYINCKTPLEWECAEGHIWQATWDKINNRKQWCPSCKFWKSQRELFDILEDIFSDSFVIKYNYRGFEWLKLKKHLEIDIWIPELKIAIEYDGEQHFKPVKRFGGLKGFIKTRKRDEIKNIKVAQHPEDVKYFIRIKYDEPLKKEHILQRLQEKNIPILGVA